MQAPHESGSRVGTAVGTGLAAVRPAPRPVGTEHPPQQPQPADCGGVRGWWPHERSPTCIPVRIPPHRARRHGGRQGGARAARPRKQRAGGNAAVQDKPGKVRGCPPAPPGPAPTASSPASRAPLHGAGGEGPGGAGPGAPCARAATLSLPAPGGTGSPARPCSQGWGRGHRPAPCWGWCRSAWAAPGLLWSLRGPGGDRTAAGGCWGMRGAELHAHPQPSQPSLAAALMLWLGESPACPARLSQALGLCPTGLGLPWPLRPQEGAPPAWPHFPTVPGIPVPASGAHILGKPAGSGRCPPCSPQVHSLCGGSAGAGAGPQGWERRWRGAGAGPARCRGARGHSRPARQNRTASFKDDQAVTGIKLCFDFLISLISSAPRYGVISPLRHDSSFPP